MSKKFSIVADVGYRMSEGKYIVTSVDVWDTNILSKDGLDLFLKNMIAENMLGQKYDTRDEISDTATKVIWNSQLMQGVSHIWIRLLRGQNNEN